MQRRFLNRGFSKVAIVAGGPSADYKGAKIIKSLSGKNSPVKSFFGVGGPQMQSSNFQSHADISLIPDKPFYPTFHFDIDPRFILNFTMIPENLRYLSLYQKLKKNGFWNEFDAQNIRDVNMFITVESQLLSFRLYEKLDRRLKQETEYRPLRIHLDKTVRNYKFDHLRSIDYLLYTLPNASNDNQRFKFPSRFIGKQVVFDALAYVYSRFPDYKELVTEMSILGDTESVFELIRLNKLKTKENFRKKNSIKSNDVVLFISPGNQEWEIKANSNVIVDGVVDFSKNLKPNQNIYVIVCYQSDSEATRKITENIKLKNIPCFQIINPTLEEKYDAMSVADFGAIENGDMVFEAMALHLPTVVLGSASTYKSYFNLMYNRWVSDINWAQEGLLLPETALWNFGTKLSEFWQVWNNQHEISFDVIMKYSKLLFRMLPTQADVEENYTNSKKEDERFKLFMKPDFVVDQFLKEKFLQYEDLKNSNQNPDNWERKRKAFILGESEDYF